jgi:hypothetical protein
MNDKSSPQNSQNPVFPEAWKVADVSIMFSHQKHILELLKKRGSAIAAGDEDKEFKIA